MAFDPMTAILDIGGKVLDKVLPDREAKAKAQMEMAKLAQDGEFRSMEVQMSAILAEAKSADPWTSRARPSFMYVMYLMILCAVPMGIVAAINPETAAAIAKGMGAWLAAIPDSLWALFGAGYLGYVGSRSYDKKKTLEVKG